MSNYSIETLTVDTRAGAHSLVYDQALEDTLPTLPESFKSIDEQYQSDKLPTFKQLVEHRFAIELIENGALAEASIICDSETSKATQAVIIFAPFSDIAPKSDPVTITNFANNSDHGFLDIQSAKPHSWSQTTKSADIHGLLKAEGHGMPVITIFSPLPTGMWTSEEISKFKQGDFSAAGRIADLAFTHTQSVLHGQSSETQIDTRHYNGLSLGASMAIGSAAAALTNVKVNVASVTAQELILGPHNIPNLAKRFTVKARIGEAGNIKVTDDTVILPEAAMRAELDRDGAELAMYPQMLAGAIKLPYMKGLTQPRCTIDDLGYLDWAGVHTTVALAKNSGLTSQTEEALLHLGDSEHKRAHVVRVEAVEGEYIDHLLNEHVRATSTIALLGIGKSLRAPAN